MAEQQRHLGYAIRSCVFIALLSVCEAATIHRDGDLGAISSLQPQVFEEVRSLAVKNPSLADRLKQSDVAKSGIEGSSLRETLWFACETCHWNYEKLVEVFPNICKLGGVLGIVNQSKFPPELVFTVSDGQWFELLFDKKGEIGFSEHPFMNPQNEFDEWRLEQTPRAGFLVLAEWINKRFSDLPLERKIKYVLINDGEFFEVKNVNFSVPPTFVTRSNGPGPQGLK